MECENWQNTYGQREKESKAIYRITTMDVSFDAIRLHRVIDTDLLRVILNNDRHGHRAVSSSFIVAIANLFSHTFNRHLSCIMMMMMKAILTQMA